MQEEILAERQKGGVAMKILAIIPARGGSKGVTGKNIRPLVGKSLVFYTINAAVKSKYNIRTVTSTDYEDIAEISRQAGAEVPFIRPLYLAQDDTPMLSVL